MSAEAQNKPLDLEWCARRMCTFIGTVKAVVRHVERGMETPEAAIAQISYGVDKLYSEIGWKDLK